MLGSRSTGSEVREAHYTPLQFSSERRESHYPGETLIPQAQMLAEKEGAINTGSSPQATWSNAA